MEKIPSRTILISSILLLYAFVLLSVILGPDEEPLYILLRLSGLIGFLSICGAVITNLFKSELRKILGKPFLAIHHIFAIVGLVCITLHPLLYALLTSDLSIFIPGLSSPYLFLAMGGRVALILIYIAVIAALYRKSYSSGWKIIHRLMYLAIILAIIHANIIGGTFENPYIRFMFNGLAGLTIIVGMLLYMKRRVIFR